MKNPFLIGNKIYMRAFESGDEKMLAQTENHPALRETLYYALPTSPELQAERWLKKSKDQHNVVFVICSKKTDELLGITSLERIDWIGRMATFYIAIASEKDWSKGFGSEVTRLMTDYAFNTLNLKRIQLHVSVDNERAVKVYKSAGFKIEGTLRQAMYHNGYYSDFYVMAVLRDDLVKVKRESK